MFTSEQLTKGEIYTRDQLQRMFNTRDATIKTGVFQPSGHQSVWLFVNENNKHNSTQYKNLLQEDTLDWDGQNEGRTDQLIIEHEKRDIELLVFYRKNKRTNGFKYEGRFRYVSHTGSKPAHFVLQRVASVSIKDSGNEDKYDPRSNKPSVLMEQKVPLKMFYCYAHEDYLLLKKLEKHLSVLKRRYNIVSWFDQAITPGMEWKKEIDAQLNTADIILLLVSPDFMASEYCYGVEMERAIERHERGEAKVVPIILRPISWQDTPLGKLQALPRNGKPVVDPFWGKRDYALHNVEEGLKAVISQQIATVSDRR